MKMGGLKLALVVGTRSLLETALIVIFPNRGTPTANVAQRFCLTIVGTQARTRNISVTALLKLSWVTPQQLCLTELLMVATPSRNTASEFDNKTMSAVVCVPDCVTGLPEKISR